MKNKKNLFNLFALVLVVLLSACTSSLKDQAIEDSSKEQGLVENQGLEKEKTEDPLEPAETTGDGDQAMVKIGAMTGPTGIGLLNLAEASENKASHYSYDFTIVTSPDELVTMLSKEDLDLAILPANLASILYNNPNLDIQVLSTNNLGVIYVLERGESIGSLEDLQGKDILAAGKATTPELVVRRLLGNIGLNADGFISFSTEATEVAQAFLAGTNDIVILPEPMVSNVLLKDPQARIALDLNEEWDKAHKDAKLITSVLVGRSDFLDTIDLDKVL